VAHARTQIRNAIVAAVTGLTTTGSSVFSSRVWPIQQSELPALVVYNDGDAVDGDMTTGLLGARKYSRVVSVIVESYAVGVSGVEDQIDQIEVEVMIALSADPTLGGLAKSLTMVRSGITLSESDQPVATSRMAFDVMYRHSEADPATALQ